MFGLSPRLCFQEACAPEIRGIKEGNSIVRTCRAAQPQHGGRHAGGGVGGPLARGAHEPGAAGVLIHVGLERNPPSEISGTVSPLALKSLRNFLNSGKKGHNSMILVRAHPYKTAAPWFCLKTAPSSTRANVHFPPRNAKDLGFSQPQNQNCCRYSSPFTHRSGSSSSFNSTILSTSLWRSATLQDAYRGSTVPHQTAYPYKQHS